MQLLVAPLCKVLSAICDRGGVPGLDGAFTMCAEATEPCQGVATLGSAHKRTIQYFL